jgi:hypothetical protein
VRPRQVRDASIAMGEVRQDPASRWVGQRREGTV